MRLEGSPETGYTSRLSGETVKKENARSLEARLRRTLARRGYALAKSRVRDPLALEFGKYYISDAWTRLRVFEGSSIESVAQWVAKMERRPQNGEAIET